MKITKGNLIPGDIVHFMDGNKYADDKYGIDFVNSHGGIDWLLTKPTPVKKVTRCNPWKDTAKMLDEMIEAHLMPDISVGTSDAKTNVTLYVGTSRKLFSDDNIHIAIGKSYQSAKENGWL